MGWNSKRLILGSLFLFIMCTSIYYFGSLALYAISPIHASSQESVVIEINKGLGPNEITKILTSKGVLSKPREFLAIGRLSRKWKGVKAGEYKIIATMTPLEVFQILSSGQSIAHPITVREGENIFEIGAELEAKGLATKETFLKLCKDTRFIGSLNFPNPIPPTLEGYLYPDTYFFNKAQTVEEMIRQMVKHFVATWTPELETKAQLLSFTRHQVITLASMIEKETGAAQERPIISSVFHNRLKKKMKLQSDPTTIYGMWERFDGNIHRKDLFAQNPYNTYYVPALPAGPIGNPGKEAILAALNPAKTEFFYFVSHNDGTHEFTKSVDDHNRAVKKFQLDPKARQGKSWRDLTRTKSR